MIKNLLILWISGRINEISLTNRTVGKLSAKPKNYRSIHFHLSDTDGSFFRFVVLAPHISRRDAADDQSAQKKENRCEWPHFA
jgi:hypothetical protein